MKLQESILVTAILMHGEHERAKTTRLGDPMPWHDVEAWARHVVVHPTTRRERLLVDDAVRLARAVAQFYDEQTSAPVGMPG